MIKPVLLACEKSGAVRDELIKRGIPAISCDILPSQRPGPHIQKPLEDVLGDGSQWAGIIGFPPCTDLAVSGARGFPEKIADGRQAYSICFFYDDRQSGKMPFYCDRKSDRYYVY